MKNYKFVILCAILLFSHGAQASHIKAHTAPDISSPTVESIAPAVRVGGEYTFVDTDVPARSAGTVAGSGKVAPAAAGLPKPSVQSFAGGANTAAAKAGLAHAQASAERIAEPATELLLLVALSALAIAVRRQSPT